MEQNRIELSIISFVLTSSPTIEAAEMVEKLNSGELATLKLATFSLRNLIKEKAFLSEFLNRGGLKALQQVIQKSSGNTLAYSLLTFQNLMELEEPNHQALEPGFVERLVEIIGKLKSPYHLEA
jgi:engulfment/cell motility protein 1